MKFAHGFQEALSREGFPSHWIDSAVPYSQLKKCIKKVEAELRTLGLDLGTLSQLTPNVDDTSQHSSTFKQPWTDSEEPGVGFQYNFSDESNALRPKLTLFVQVRDGMIVDAALSPDTRRFLERLAAEQAKLPSSFGGEESRATGEKCVDGHRDLDDVSSLEHPQHRATFESTDAARIRQVEIPLTFDAEFFGLLQEDVSTLHALQAVEEKAMVEEIEALGSNVAKVAAPSPRIGKSDLYLWREIFDIYLQASVFFSTHELDHGSRNSDIALKQLQWFQAEVTKRGLVRSFKVRASNAAFEQFTRINFTLLKNLKFQEINQLAIAKILKKFDKRTSLGAKQKVPQLLRWNPISSDTTAKAVCSSLSSELIRVVPQIDDYLCPICYSISYKPVRLSCGHVFCIRCMVELQRARTNHCPLCREGVILAADSDNLDASLMNFLRKYFPKETKAKQKENEIAAGVDLYGERYRDMRCEIM